MAGRVTDDIRVALSRDSVAAGDDVDAPHAKTLTLPATATLSDLCTAILDQHYLAQIAGGQASWVVRSGDRALAVLAQQWRRALFLTAPDIPVKKLCDKDGSCTVHITYHQQQDPMDVARAQGGATGQDQ